MTAARVTEAVTHVRHELFGYFKTLVEIHAATPWLWPALVEAMLAGWTVQQTHAAVGRWRIAATNPVQWLKPLRIFSA